MDLLKSTIIKHENSVKLVENRIENLREEKRKLKKELKEIEDNLSITLNINSSIETIKVEGIEKLLVEWLVSDSKEIFVIPEDICGILIEAIINKEASELIEHVISQDVECNVDFRGRIKGYKGRETVLNKIDSLSFHGDENPIYNERYFREYLIDSAPDQIDDWSDEYYATGSSSFTITILSKKTK